MTDEPLKQTTLRIRLPNDFIVTKDVKFPEDVHSTLSLNEWAALTKPTPIDMQSIVEMLSQNNDLLGECEPPPLLSWYERLRNAVGRKLAEIAFNIAPDVRDEYY